MNRRNVIKILTSGAAVSLAGCSSDGGESDATTSPGSTSVAETVTETTTTTDIDDETTVETERETETPSDVGRIARENDDGEVFQTATVTRTSGEVRPGGVVSVTGEVSTEISAAGGNIVYGAVGSPSGDLYGLERMSGSGSGTVTVSATIPTDATGPLVWTFVPATSESAARTQFADEADAGRYESGELAIELGTVADTEPETETETETETPSDPDRIARENDDGDVFQTATVTDSPDEIRAGETVSVTGKVNTEISSARSNIVYGAVGSPSGDLYGLTQMSGAGSGTVTVSAEIPDDADGTVIWTFIPATSRSEARTQFTDEADAGRYVSGELAIELGSVSGTETETETPSDPDRIARENDDGDVFQTATVTDSPDEVPAGETVSVTGEITAELSTAEGNIIYGAVGTPSGDLYGLAQMSGSGSGTVTVSAEIPDDADGTVIWTFIPATSESAARTQFADEADAGRYESGELAIELGSAE